MLADQFPLPNQSALHICLRLKDWPEEIEPEVLQ